MAEKPEESRETKLKSFRTKLAATVGSGVGSQGCSLSEMSKRFKEDWHEPISKYVELFGCDTDLQLLKEVQESVVVFTNAGEVWVRPVVTFENKHIYALIDQSNDKSKPFPTRPYKNISRGASRGFYQSMGPHPSRTVPFQRYFERPSAKLSSLSKPFVSKSKVSKKFDSNGFQKSVPFNSYQGFDQSQPVRMPKIVQKISKQMSSMEISHAQSNATKSEANFFVPTFSSILKDSFDEKQQLFNKPLPSQPSFFKANVETKPLPIQPSCSKKNQEIKPAGSVFSLSGLIFSPPSFDSNKEMSEISKQANFSSIACPLQHASKPLNDSSSHASVSPALSKTKKFCFNTFKSAFKTKDYVATCPFKTMFSSADALPNRSSLNRSLPPVQSNKEPRKVDLELVSNTFLHDQYAKTESSDNKSQCTKSEVSSNRLSSKFSARNNLLKFRQLKEINEISQTNVSRAERSRFMSMGWKPDEPNSGTLPHNKSPQVEPLVDAEPFTSVWKEQVMQSKPSMQKVQQCIMTTSKRPHLEFFDKDYFLSSLDKNLQHIMTKMAYSKKDQKKIMRDKKLQE